MRKRVCVALLALSFLVSLAGGAPTSAKPVGGETPTVSPH
jgi:hypothetical protein